MLGFFLKNGVILGNVMCCDTEESLGRLGLRLGDRAIDHWLNSSISQAIKEQNLGYRRWTSLEIYFFIINNYRSLIQ